MKEFLEEVKKALDNKMYIAALMLGLTIPDIFGNIEYPDLKGPSNSKKRYIQWYDEHVTQYLGDSDTEDGSSHMTNGESAYKIRCAVLHSFDISEAEDDSTEIHFDLFKSKIFAELIMEVNEYLKTRFPNSSCENTVDAISSSKTLDDKLNDKLNTGISVYVKTNLTKYKVLEPNVNVPFHLEQNINLVKELGQNTKILMGFDLEGNCYFGLSWDTKMKIISLNVPQLVYPMLWCAEKYYKDNKDLDNKKFPVLFSHE